MTKSKRKSAQHLARHGASATMAGIGRITLTATAAGAVAFVVAVPLAKYLESRLQHSEATAALAATRGR